MNGKFDTNINLNDEQQYAVKTILDGGNVALIGKAGTGKSLVIEAIKYLSNKQIVCLAPTGIAALNINGSTIHRFFNLPIYATDPWSIMPPDDIEQIELINTAEIIVIDEISMVRSDIFQAIDTQLRNCCSDSRRDLPLAGKQLLVVGDFFQLSPVVKEAKLHEYLDYELGGIYAFNAPAWQSANFNHIILRHSHRQSDPEFVEILDAIRTGNIIKPLDQVNPENGGQINYINELNRITRQCEPDFNRHDLSICATRDTVRQINLLAAQNLHGEAFVLRAKSAFELFPWRGVYPVDTTIHLKKGMKVMLVANQYTPDRKQFEYVNGDIGFVLDYTPFPPKLKVELKNGKIVDVRLFSWQYYDYELNFDPQQNKRIITQKVVDSFIQMPVMPAAAITIHKSQSSTINAVNVVLGTHNCFASGLLYVAASRCPKSENLSFDRTVRKEDLIIDEKILEFFRKTDKTFTTDMTRS